MISTLPLMLILSASLELDVVLDMSRLYEPPATLRFTVVTPFDPDNREAGVELRCNTQPVASAIWTLDEKSGAAREFRWPLREENCLYELVVVLTRTKDYLYVYQMVPSRAWLSFRTPGRQSGRGSLRSPSTRSRGDTPSLRETVGRR
jgi:hypothetical protein